MQMGQFGRTGFSFDFRGIGPVTKGLCAALVAVSLVGSVTQRSLGIGVQELVFSSTQVLNLELWRLVTYPFAETQPLGLILSAVILWLFGGWFERKWGSKDFLRFFFVTAVGAAAVAIPLSFLVDAIMPFRDLGIAAGPSSVFDALLISLAITAPRSHVMLGFVLPIQARTLVFILLGFQLIVGLMNGAAALSITLGGMLMGYLLTTGNWRPRRLFDQYRIWRMRRRRRGLYVVPPKDRTLHRGSGLPI